MVTGRQDSRLELHSLFSLRHFPEQVMFYWCSEVRTLVYGSGVSRLWQTQKLGPCDAGIAVWHPTSCRGFSRSGGHLCFQAQPRCRDQSIAYNVCRWRPVCTWGLVVWTGFVNLPTKAHFCNNQGTQAILVPLQLHGHPQEVTARVVQCRPSADQGPPRSKGDSPLIANGSEEAGSQGAARQKSLLVFRTEKVNCLLRFPPWG